MTVATPPRQTSVNNLMKVCQKTAFAYLYLCYNAPFYFIPTNNLYLVWLMIIMTWSWQTKISLVTLVTCCSPLFGSGTNFLLVKSSHSSKFLLFKVPTVQSSYCSKFPQFKVPTVQSSFYCSKLLLFKVPTVQSSYCSKFLLFKAPAMAGWSRRLRL